MISVIFSSFSTSDIFSLLTIFIILYVTQFYYKYFTRPNPLPGPLPIPILGNAHQQFGHELNDWFMILHKKYGDIFEITLNQRFIVLCRPELIENMVIPSTKSKYPSRFVVTEDLKEYFKSIGLGIISNDVYENWKYNRQLFIQSMTTSNFNNQAIEWTTELWEQMESYWNNLGNDYELDLTKWMKRFTNDMIFKITTGIKNDSVLSYYNTLIINNNMNEKEKEKIEESEKFIQSLDTYIGGLMIFFVFNKFIRRYVPFFRDYVKKLFKNRDYLFDKVINIIKKRRIEIDNTPLDQPLRHDMLTSHITMNTSRHPNAVRHVDADFLKPMTDREIVGNMLDSMLGGTDTTANLFCFIVYYLGHYPEVKQKLQHELETVFGKDSGNPITSKDLDELRYCEAIIKEVYRHIPMFFTVGRVNIENINCGGYNWPKDTSFQMLFSAIMMYKDYWTDPEKFDPDRFYDIEKSDKYLLEKQHVKNSFFMWGGGIRICPGRKLAMIELKCLLSLIYRKYDIEMADMNAPLKYKSAIITTSKELFVKVKPRNL
ncbi:hypothetical protein RclHR1_05420004 [Rhizophagus clarus]|uniref:Cytochrome P450 n=1 Tax=Rhizophagus clarus TaxID=94130 RepID=A0A2Z6S498_9GLOM|nr:hypothetical protein RclHR1_05420004 [Rhizophagus clarus]GES75617.1 cytochrome P450 [Rhizophagus clarus]